MHRPPIKWLVLSLAVSLAQGVAIPQEDVPELPAEGNTATVTMTDRELERMADYLASLLREDPWAQNEDPLLYVEAVPRRGDDPAAPAGNAIGDADDADRDGDDADVTVRKRSRYYRRYPWKRVSRARPSYYDSEMFACTPSRHDVLQLLVGLHRAREGESGRTINFCNRKRPASSVFTNIRFIGRRK